VNTAQPSDPVFWYDQERAARVEEAAREFREYNSAEISEFAARERAEWQRVEPPADGIGQAATLSEACQSVGGWILPYFVRADALASRVERVFNVTSWAMFLAAAGAVVSVACQVAFAPHQPWIAAIEILLLLLLVVMPLVSRRRRLLDRWISYRFLAERLRSGYFLALAGAGDRPPPRDRNERAGWSSDPTEVWLRRALEEVTALRPQVRIGPGDLAPLRDYLCDRWLGAQIRYHEKSARRQGTWDSRLFLATGVLFAITAVAAFLHLLGWGDHDGNASELGIVLIVLSICVPAVGAALHGIRTRSEFRRHAQRYQRMAVLLRQLEADLSRAQSIEWIHEIAADAERVMRAENSDWFGVMRFHDVELITLGAQSATVDSMKVIRPLRTVNRMVSEGRVSSPPPSRRNPPIRAVLLQPGRRGRLAGNIYGTACALSGEGPHAKAVALHGLMLRSAGHRGACSRSECAQPGVRSDHVFLPCTRTMTQLPWTSAVLFEFLRAEAGMDAISRPTDVIRA
jgi:hypothetical protein